MSYNIYKKLTRGKNNYSEDKLIRGLKAEFDKRISANPAFETEINTATNMDELKALHEKYCISDAEIISEEPTSAANEALKTAGAGEKTGPSLDHKFEGQDTVVDDPFNRANPKVRDYVLDEGAMSPEGKTKVEIGGQGAIDEPKDFQDAFRLPGGDSLFEDEKPKKGAGPQPGNNNQSNGNGNNAQPGKKQEPLNPAFDEMTNAKKTKQTKRFAKYITETVCSLFEKGYVWWVTKDIDEAKRAEYDISGEIDTSLLVSMDGIQEETVASFFKKTCADAVIGAKIGADDREELADALADIMLEKGIAPTPMQVGIMVALKVFGMKILSAVVQKSPINMILEELRKMNAGKTKSRHPDNDVSNQVPTHETDHDGSGDEGDERPSPTMFEDVTDQNENIHDVVEKGLTTAESRS